MTNPCSSHELQGFLFVAFRTLRPDVAASVMLYLMRRFGHTALRRGIQGYPFMSFRAVTRYPEIPAKAGTRKRHFTGPRIECGVCSFFSAARRTNQEAPPLLSGFVGRRLAPSSGAAELAALRQSSPSLLGRLASSRPDKGGGIATLHRKCPGHFAVRYPKIYRPISSFRAATRNPEIPGHGITQDARTVRHYSTHCHLQKPDPASNVG